MEDGGFDLIFSSFPVDCLGGDTGTALRKRWAAALGSNTIAWQRRRADLRAEPRSRRESITHVNQVTSLFFKMTPNLD